jgi:hypothetical protein
MRLGDAGILLEEALGLREERKFVDLREANGLEAGEPLSPPLVRLGVSLVNNDVFLLGETPIGGRDS